MAHDLGSSLLTVFGVLTGIGALLYVLAVIDPTSVSSRRTPRSRR